MTKAVEVIYFPKMCKKCNRPLQWRYKQYYCPKCEQ